MEGMSSGGVASDWYRARYSNPPCNQRPRHTHTHPSLLQIKYPSVSTALTKDFKLIEAQMEVDIADANDLNQRYVSNLQERIIAQEASLAKSVNVTKSKFMSPN